jgi:hypothetical protein
MKNIFTNQGLFKESIQCIGYILLVATLSRLIAPTIRGDSIFIVIVFTLVICTLVSFICMYVVMYVITPILKLYFPDFTGIYEEPKPNRRVFDPAIWLFILISSLVVTLAIGIVGVAIKNISAT